MPSIKEHIIDLMSDCQKRHFSEVTDQIIARGATFDHKSPRSKPSATVSSTMYRANDIFDALGGGVYRMRHDYKKLLSKKLDSTNSTKQKVEYTIAKIEPKSEKLPSPKSWKKDLFLAQKGICNGCCDKVDEKYLQIDHKIPKAKGGTDHFDNLQLLCGSCNQKKGHRTMQEWKNTNWFQSVVEAHLDHGDEYVRKVDADAELAKILKKFT